jgi:hypothetical protein
MTLDDDEEDEDDEGKVFILPHGSDDDDGNDDDDEDDEDWGESPEGARMSFVNLPSDPARRDQNTASTTVESVARRIASYKAEQFHVQLLRHVVQVVKEPEGFRSHGRRPATLAVLGTLAHVYRTHTAPTHTPDTLRWLASEILIWRHKASESKVRRAAHRTALKLAWRLRTSALKQNPLPLSFRFRRPCSRCFVSFFTLRSDVCARLGRASPRPRCSITQTNMHFCSRGSAKRSTRTS